MARRIPPRKPTRIGRGTTPFIRYEEVGGVPKRGQVFAEVQARQRTLRELGFVVNLFSGEVKRPLFKETTEWGRIEKSGEATTKGLSKSERREVHKADNVQKERETLTKISKEMGEVHAYIVKHPLLLRDPVMRERLATKLLEFVKAIGPRSRKKSKKDAVVRLLKAIELTRKGNDGAVAASLIGTFRDIGERLSTLNIHQPLTGRTANVHTKEVREVMNGTRDWLKHTRDMMVALSKSAQPEQMERVAIYCERNAFNLERALQSDSPTEARRIQESFAEAGKQLRAGKRDAAMETLRRARTYQLGLYAHHFVLPSQTIRLIPKWSVPEMRSAAISRQVGLVEENLEYWRSLGRSSWILPWMRTLSGVAAQIPSERPHVRRINEAIRLLNVGNVEKAREEMRAFVERK